jgi:light-regulated signal transduction histidine kinase (bacteriophytochrome)
LKALSGYDRVMAYRFFKDGHGEVIAEARDSSLKAYLGQHYPASDIPPQARSLYLRQRIGAIVDSSYIRCRCAPNPPSMMARRSTSRTR